MYRLFGAVGVLILIIVIGTASFVESTKASEEILDKLESAYSLADSGKIKAASIAMKEAANRMNEHSEILCLTHSHQVFDEISLETEKAIGLLEHGEREQFIASCRSIVFRIRDFKELEFPTLKNIL